MFDNGADRMPAPPSLSDVLDAPGGVAVWAAAARPGPDVVELVSMLDPVAVGADERIDLLVAVERQLAWLAALQQWVLASLEADPLRLGCDRDDDWTREQVGAALRLAAGTADRRLTTARQLADRLPGTAAALARGEISYLHAVKLVEAVKDLDDATAAAVQARVLPGAVSQTVGQFAAAVQRAVLALDPRTGERKHADALERRRVEITPAEDGMSWLSAFLPAEGAALIDHVLDSLASVTSAGEERSCDQRRADALVDVFARVLGDPSLPEQHGARPAVQVTVRLSTLLGLDDEPGELAGYGPVTAQVALRMATDPTGTWRRLVTDPVTGDLLDYGHTTYRPPADLTEFVIARDQHCVFPGCRRRGRRCDLDHEHPWQAGGPTNPANLAALCRRHHRAKHHAGWRRRRQPDGSYRWTAPTGHEYTVTPPKHPPDG
jgi:hypothetical protein